MLEKQSMVAVDKATFLRAIAAHEGVRDALRQQSDEAGDVATPYRMRGGAVLGRTIESPRLPFSRPARYFLLQAFIHRH